MRMQSLNDQQLVNAYNAGNHQAFAELLSRHKEKIYTSIYLFVRNDAVAEDIFQDTFVKIIESLRRGRYSEEGKFLPWAMRIAYNLCIDNYRKNKRAPKVTTSEGFDIFNILDFTEDNAEDMMVKNEARAKVRKLIDELPPEQREVVVLRHYADMSFKEIAKMTDVSINTALGRMRYALINMRKMIEAKQIVI